jgi:cation:H+ antiporter
MGPCILSVVSRLRHPLVAVSVAFLLTAPWVAVFLTGTHLAAIPTVAVSGLAVLGASFLLAWGAETAEKDVPRAFAIAVLAVLAVAPEYAVDALYAWEAGSKGATIEACKNVAIGEGETAVTTLQEGCQAANLAVANMTGANRILIGLGWSGIAIFTIYRAFKTGDSAVKKREGFLADVIRLDRGIATEIAFLFFATIWAFLVPLGGGIDIFDTLVLVGLYVAYILIIIRGDVDEHEEQVGVPAYFQAWRRPARVFVVLFLMGYAGAMIFTAVEPFAHGLESIGLQFGVPEFFMIQWIAPLASESPELIVVAVLVNKARSTAGFNALISSKLNQWTLLIGTLAVVFSIAGGAYGVLPFDEKQTLEVWLTAAQSFFALAILINFRISLREAVALLVLFVSQVAIEFLILRVLSVPNPEGLSHAFLLAYSVIYVVLGAAMFVQRRRSLRKVVGIAADAGRTAIGREPAHPEFAD